eukprot:8493541-Pyramimonas_sp.AAC.1
MPIKARSLAEAPQRDLSGQGGARPRAQLETLREQRECVLTFLRARRSEDQDASATWIQRVRDRMSQGIGRAHEWAVKAYRRKPDRVQKHGGGSSGCPTGLFGAE